MMRAIVGIGIRLTAFALLLAASAGADTDLPDEVMLLKAIRAHMKEQTQRLNNYTCLETITRGVQPPERLAIAVPGKTVPFRRIDTIRLEIAEVGQNELFARPGEHNFAKREPAELASGGMMGDGVFVLFAHNIFVANVATYKYRGEETLEGRPVVRFDYEVPQFLSGFRFTSTYGSAILGYHGSFWADPVSLDPVRLDVIADSIPPELRISGSADRIDFARVRIGEENVLLPQSAAMTVWQDRQGASRNQIAFTHCREYGVQSVIKFDDSSEPSGLLDSQYVDLPPGVQLSLMLETPIDAATSQIGDLISARVEMDAMHKKVLAVPKDAIVSGRLRRMEVHKEGWPYVLAGLEFTLIEFNGKQSRFFAELEKLTLPPGADGPKRVAMRDLPGVGMVSATGNNLRLPKGTRMVWKTISYQQAAEIGK
jgi:hypothetical protein